MFRHDFADFSCQKFPKMFRRDGKSHSKLFIQENCPVRNCVKARRALIPSAFAIETSVCAKLFTILVGSCHINPIEKEFNSSRTRILAPSDKQ